MGPLMTLVGFVWFLGGLTYANSALVFNVGVLLSALWIGALVQMLVSYPTGSRRPRPRARARRRRLDRRGPRRR